MEIIQSVLPQIADKPQVIRNFTPKIPYLLIHDENERIKQIVIPHLNTIEREINDLIFVQIKNCNDLSQADVYFSILKEIMTVVLFFAYAETVEIPEKLFNLIRDIDHLYDKDIRENMYYESHNY